MNKTLLLICLFLVSFSSYAGISILSDLDDTIKITEASGKPEDLLGEDVYTGMPEFYSAAREYAPTLHILSASPSFLRSKIRSVLKKHGIRHESLILRGNVFEDKFTYKVREISRLLDKSSDDFILLGDDIGKDPEVYSEILRLYPGRILGAYIHVVRGRSIPEDLMTYWTSFDLLLREFETSRAGQSWIKKVFKKLKAEKDMEMIFPREAHCPTEAIVWDWQVRTIFMREAQELITRFTTFCQNRQTGKPLL